MQQIALTKLMVELYQRLTAGPPSEGFVESVRQHRRDCDLEDDATVPGWLTDMFCAALKGRETNTVRFQSIGSDASSFMLEMSELIPGWKHDEQGESIEIEFPSLGVHIHLSRESRNDAGTHCCSYKVTRTTDLTSTRGHVVEAS